MRGGFFGGGWGAEVGEAGGEAPLADERGSVGGEAEQAGREGPRTLGGDRAGGRSDRARWRGTGQAGGRPSGLEVGSSTMAWDRTVGLILFGN